MEHGNQADGATRNKHNLLKNVNEEGEAEVETESEIASETDDEDEDFEDEEQEEDFDDNGDLSEGGYDTESSCEEEVIVGVVNLEQAGEPSPLARSPTPSIVLSSSGHCSPRSEHDSVDQSGEPVQVTE